MDAPLPSRDKPFPFRALVAVLLLLGLSAGAAERPSTVPQPKPNFLMISVDDLNDWVGFLGGHPLVRTPHLDRLARRSVVFTQAYCAAPVCGPSRAAVFTGLAPTHTGMYSNANRLRTTFPDARFVHQHLAEHGYYTMGTGKLLHGNQGGPESFHEYGPGFNKWKPLTTAETLISKAELQTPGPYVQHRVSRPDGFELVLPLNKMPRDRNRGANRIESFDWGPIDRPESEWSDTQCANWAIQQLGKRHSKPFFLGVGFYRPHQPLWAPKKYHDLYPPEQMPIPGHLKSDLDDVPFIGKLIGRTPLTSGAHATVLAHHQWQEAISSYLACISFVDAQIGRVIHALESSSHAENTVVILWSDHGWHLGEKEHWGKFTAWERATRVPLLVCLPNRYRANLPDAPKTCDSPVSLLDLYPTILQLAEVNLPGKRDGTSLVPTLLGKEAAPDRYVATSVGPGNHSLRNKRWRYIHYYDGTHELYDLQRDPEERHNLADNPIYLEPIERFQKALPQDERISHFVRIDEWKAIVKMEEHDAPSIALFGPGVHNIDGAPDVARAHPDMIQRVKKYLTSNPNAPRFSVLRQDESAVEPH